MNAPRILLVEDSTLDEAKIIALLKMARPGVEVVVAGSVADARHQMERQTFDLVLCDLVLADNDPNELLSGYEPIRRAAGKVPIAILSGHPEPRVGAAATVGAVAWLRKPDVRAPDLRALIEEAIGQWPPQSL